MVQSQCFQNCLSGSRFHLLQLVFEICDFVLEGLKFFRSWASHRLGGPLGSIMNPQTADGQEGEHQEGWQFLQQNAPVGFPDE